MNRFKPASFDHRKYQASDRVDIPDRQWPNRHITQAPQWCSVDLRDGNQALPSPMNSEQKWRLFQQLVRIGFKEIEVGFPAASQTDFDFVRRLIEENAIPDDVTIQVLTQAREDIIARSFEALRGARRAIMHVYNSTSTAQRKYVFRQNRDGIRTIAEQGARWVQDIAACQPETEWVFQYSPESFTQTELDFAIEACEAVCDIWRPDQGQAVIINLPSTVEVHTPNVFADRIEWFNRHFRYRDQVRVSVHTHNDRGCAVASAELAVLAGADRVEGTLLGNGERTGNMDIVTMAMNLYSQGVDPELDFEDMANIVACVEACTNIPTSVRHPYVGELVYTAFSGSHQDAINKGLRAWDDSGPWDVPYLPIDPRDIGRDYEAVIRVNSQSGKGGVAFALEQDYGLQLPRALQIAFSPVVQAYSEQCNGEVRSEEIYRLFNSAYSQRQSPWRVQHYQVQHHDDDRVDIRVELSDDQQQSQVLQGSGEGALAAMVDALNRLGARDVSIVDYHEHALGSGTDVEAVSYICIAVNGKPHWGVGRDHDTLRSALHGLVSAFNRAVTAEVQSAVA